jgi:hypothetical protein
MNILYLSCHSIAEYDECKLFHELGHNFFSPGGSYENPQNPTDPKRPPIDAPVYQQLMDVSRQSDKSNLHPELVSWADVIIDHFMPSWISGNAHLLGRKPLIWRTNGQNVGATEADMQRFRDKGLKIVRYSEAERNLPSYAGEDAVIRFGKDPDEYGGWVGNHAVVCNFTQSMKQRGPHCHYDTFKLVTEPFKTYLYGPGNEDSGFEGGLIPYDKLKEVLRNCRVYFYCGTEPAPYTLNFIEAWMTGIPIVALGPKLANTLFPDVNTYDIPNLITNGVDGFYSDDIETLRDYIKLLLTDVTAAHQIGSMGRQKATRVFGIDKTREGWKNFLESL